MRGGGGEGMGGGRVDGRGERGGRGRDVSCFYPRSLVISGYKKGVKKT